MIFKILLLALLLSITFAQNATWVQILNNAENDTTRWKPRYGHRVNKINDVLYLFGGYDGDEHLEDLWKLDLRNQSESQNWTLVNVSGACPGPRALHLSITVDDKIYVFGGRNDTHALNDFWMLEVTNDTVRWTQLEDAPIKAFDAGGVILGSDENKTLYVIGGRNETSDITDILTYDFNLNQWQVITPSNQIQPRSGHSVVVMNDTIVLFGGFSLEDNSFPSDVMVFDVNEKSWTPMQLGESITPVGRYGHSANLIDNQMAVFGGWDGMKYLNDLWVLKDNQWKEMNVTGTKPSERALHGAVVTDNNTLYIIGGATSLDTGLNDMWKLTLE